jgi:hypothetical protein
MKKIILGILKNILKYYIMKIFGKIRDFGNKLFGKVREGAPKIFGKLVSGANTVFNTVKQGEDLVNRMSNDPNIHKIVNAVKSGEVSNYLEKAKDAGNLLSDTAQAYV